MMKIACLLADGFEDVEALATSALLRRAGIIVDFYSIYNKKMVKGSYETVVSVTYHMKKLNVKNYDALFVPGGRAAFSIRNDEFVQSIVQAFYDENKWLFAICAGPTVFGLMGIMDGIKYTSYPGTEKDMSKAIRLDEKAVSDGRFITARSVGAVYEFVFEIIKAMKGEDALKKFKENIVY
jgi:putative intracellular protease/amidase